MQCHGPIMLRALTFGSLLLLLLTPPLARGQPADSTDSVSDDCTGAAFRAFDFWVGQWIVRDSTGTQVGTSRISIVARGCGILEEWTGTSGSRGTSLNYYDPATDTWHQDWVGDSGLLLHLAGGLKDGAMVLTGTRRRDGDTVRDRIRWRELPGGRVRQEWRTSSDGGETWERAFLGVYEPTDGQTNP